MTLHFECTVAQNIETVFHFHDDPENLGRLLNGWPGFRLLHHDGHIRPGAETWIEQSMAGYVPVVMGFRHTIYEPPHRFAEAMIHGPFRSLSHIHEFERADDGTIVRDLLDVNLPWYYGGDKLTQLAVVPIIRKIFAYRHKSLQRLIELDCHSSKCHYT